MTPDKQGSSGAVDPKLFELSELSEEQLNTKIAKLTGWKFDNGKWWHDQLGDGPPINFCAMLSRPQVEQWITGILAKATTVSQAVGGETAEEIARRIIRRLSGTQNLENKIAIICKELARHSAAKDKEIKELAAENTAMRSLCNIQTDHCFACGGINGHEEGCLGITGLMAMAAELAALREEKERLTRIASDDRVSSAQSNPRLNPRLIAGAALIELKERLGEHGAAS